MKQFLTFAMVAPMASFGDIAVGERRDSRDRPARSAVLGLVAACLGLTREDEEAHKELEQKYGLAVLCHAAGKSLVDYHTAQAGQPGRGQVFATRAEEIHSGDLATILSRREYRTDVWHLGALWLREGASPQWSLEELQTAMNEPLFTLYLGRRSCPLALPLAPKIIEENSAASALQKRHRGLEGAEKEIRLWHKLSECFSGTRPYMDQRNKEAAVRAAYHSRPLRLYMGQEDEEAIKQCHEAGFKHQRSEMRRDRILSRQRWQFGLREEAVLSLNHEKGREE